jgi:hypothetical protein
VQRRIHHAAGLQAACRQVALLVTTGQGRLKHRKYQGCRWVTMAPTMPQRETVAGEATARSMTSKIMFCTYHMASSNEVNNRAPKLCCTWQASES